MFLQTFPKQKIYVAMNLLPNYLVYRFREPGGVQIMADGACSMGRWAVKDSRQDQHPLPRLRRRVPTWGKGRPLRPRCSW